MGRYRKVEISTWGDEKFNRLSKIEPSGKSLWLYLLTGSQTLIIPGVLNTGKAAIAESLEWEISDVTKHFAEIEAEGMATADWKARIVWLPNGILYNPPENPSIARSWSKEFAVLGECEVRQKIKVAIDALMITMDENSAKHGRNGGYFTAWAGNQKFSTGGHRSQQKNEAKPDATTDGKDSTSAPVTQQVTQGVTHGALDNATQGVTHGALDGASHRVTHPVTHDATHDATNDLTSPQKPAAVSVVATPIIEPKSLIDNGSDGDGLVVTRSDAQNDDTTHGASHPASDGVTHYRSSSSSSISNSSSNSNSINILPEAVASGFAHGQQADQGPSPEKSDVAPSVIGNEAQKPKAKSAVNEDELFPAKQFDLIAPVADPVFCEIPLVGMGGGTVYSVLESKVREYEVCFPGIDVRQNIRSCRQWSIDNPAKRKTAKGVTGYINRWLSESQNRASSNRVPVAANAGSGFGRPAVAPQATDEQLTPAFLRFWSAYPSGRGDRNEVVLVWAAMHSNASTDEVDRIVRGVQGWALSDEWVKDGGKFILNPSKFLREERWKAVPTSRHFGLSDRSIHQDEARFSGMTLREMLEIQENERNLV